MARPLPPRDAKTGRFVKVPTPSPLDPQLLKRLRDVIVVPVREPRNVLEALLPRDRIDHDSEGYGYA